MTDQMSTTETKPLTNVRNIVEYAIRTAAAYGYSKGKRGTDIKANIGDLIDQAARQVAAHDREVAADAVLTVLADLPDTAVEAGAEATRLHRVSVEYDGDYGEIVFLECRCGWGPSDNGDTPAMWAEAYAHENHERQAAVFAAIKEGKA